MAFTPPNAPASVQALAAFASVAITRHEFTVSSGSDTLVAVGHVFGGGERVKLSPLPGGSLPAPLVAGRIYYVRDVVSNNLKLGLTPTGGSAIVISSNGGGFIYQVGVA